MQEIEAPPSGGYLFIQDDAPFSHCMIPRFNKSQVRAPSQQQFL